MKKKLVLGTLVASFGMLSIVGGCSGIDKRLADAWVGEQQDAIITAREGGVPAAELDRLVEEAAEWIAEVAPTHSGVVESSYQKIFVVGGTVNRSTASPGYESVSDEEVTIRTEDLFNDLQIVRSMSDNFVFFDRTTDFNVDLSNLTGDLGQYGDPLGRGNDALPDTYSPNDIYLVKLSFNERQDLREKNAKITFTLRAVIEWGGRPGQSLYSNKFESKLVFSDGYLLGVGAKGWVPAED